MLGTGRGGSRRRSACRRPAAVAIALASLFPVAGCGTAARHSRRPVVTVFGSFTDHEAAAFTASVRTFERETGIDVRYVGSDRFETDLLERVRRGDPPDLAVIPQPGLVRSLAEEGYLLPYDGALATAAATDIDPRLVDLATVGGQVYGSWYSVTPKSLVWYSPRQFAARGLSAPATWDDLIALTDTIAASGAAPWCLGVRDGGATGWVATDWVEDIVLRFAGPDVYDRWVTHDVSFSDAEITDAIERFGAIALNPQRVNGGNRAAVEFTVQQAAQQLLGRSPKCLLHRQAGFLTDFLHGSVDVAPDGDLWAFPFPGPAGADSSMLLGGSLVSRFADRPEVRQLAEYLTTPEAARERAAQGGFISPLESVAPDAYPSALNRTIAQWTLDAAVIRFDASDLMPPEVGVSAFWAGMTSWLGGARLSTTVAQIDQAWPRPTTKPAPVEDRGDSEG